VHGRSSRVEHSLSCGAGQLQGSDVWHLGAAAGHTAPVDLTLNHSNWTEAGGSATLTGLAGFSATVLRTGDNGFTVTT
jgi:hypothetical protein